MTKCQYINPYTLYVLIDLIPKSESYPLKTQKITSIRKHKQIRSDYAVWTIFQPCIGTSPYIYHIFHMKSVIFVLEKQGNYLQYLIWVNNNILKFWSKELLNNYSWKNSVKWKCLLKTLLKKGPYLIIPFRLSLVFEF